MTFNNEHHQSAVALFCRKPGKYDDYHNNIVFRHFNNIQVKSLLMRCHFEHGRCIISAMSGVAVLPYLASTEKQFSAKADPSSLSPHYQSVITMARTACGLDAMIAICMAEVALGFIFADGMFAPETTV